jgi:cytochrome P450
MATWFIFCIIQSGERLQKFREIIQPLILQQSKFHLKQDDLRFDMASLRAHPYIRGLWNEALRLGSASAAARVVARDTELEGYVLKRGSVVLLPVRLLHFDEKIFEDPNSFIPERWISYLPPSATEEERTMMAEKQQKQNASLRSFGGGTGLCSGRFVAEEEILSTVSTMLAIFDIELMDSGLWKPNPRSIGIMSPTRELRVRIRKRQSMG